MTRPRYVIVSRRFWPILDDSTYRLQAWLRQLKKLGVDVSLLTVQWNYRWPLKCSLVETAIQRIGPPPLALRSFRSYLKSVLEHLTTNQSSYDAILFDDCAEEAIACGNSKDLRGKPKLYWFESHDAVDGRLGVDHLVYEACRNVDQVLVHGAAEERLLRSGGITAEKVHRLGQVSVPAISRTASERERARRILGECCGDLFIPEDGKVIVVPTQMQQYALIEMFLNAIDPLLDRFVNLRVWFIGDGPQRGQIYERIRDMDGARQIALPGCFDAIEEIFQVADACVITTPSDGLNYYAPVAWQCGLPCLLPSSSLTRERTPEFARSGLYAADNTVQLQDLIHDALQRSPSWSGRGQQARNLMSEGTGWCLEPWRYFWGANASMSHAMPASPHNDGRRQPSSYWKKWSR